MMRIAITPARDGQAWIRRLGPDDDRPILLSPRDLMRLEHTEQPRWIIADTRTDYPVFLRHGVRFDRCHDLRLAEAILLSTEGSAGAAADLATAHARATRQRLPETKPSSSPTAPTLFNTDPEPDPAGLLEILRQVHDSQQQRQPDNRVKSLIAAESAGGLIAAEMTHAGLPWRIDIHHQILTDLLGAKPIRGLRPAKLQKLANDISEAFGHQLNPDSPAQVLRAFKNAGHAIETTRSFELSKIDHPAVAPLQRYKELARIHNGHGWNWATEWISDGPSGTDSPQKRLRPGYVVGGVVTGRWATHGGGALQIPKTIRRAVTADHGKRLVVADASQLEPRMLAAMSNDHAMALASASDDLYAALAPTFGGQRDDAKIALLSAMYGGTTGNASALLAVMRQRFPYAWQFVEESARTGERGGLVKTWLGRTCNPASHTWWSKLTGPDGSRAARDRGRFTRNFVVQGTAAEWALIMMAFLRHRLFVHGLGELVFFQHDEIIVHCDVDATEAVAKAITVSSDDATSFLFGTTDVRVPLVATAVVHYSDVT